jgi:hypothetical protein
MIFFVAASFVVEFSPTFKRIDDMPLVDNATKALNAREL